jgi:hypothetical protein
MQVFDLPNVRCKEEYKGRSYKVDSKLEEVITKCAMNNPLWQFIATHYSEYSVGFNQFEVRASNDEILGTIARDWVRGTTGVCIENDRIKSKRTRGGGYTTTDVNKALLQIKKTFAPMNVLERASKAKKEAEHVMKELISRERYDARNLEHEIERKAVKWVMETGFTIFSEHVRNENPQAYNNLMEITQKYKTQTDCQEETKNIWEGISEGGSILLIKESSNYIVQRKGKAEVFNDSNLPEEYKANLGILKLVDNKAVIEGRGCRINENTFVIKVEQQYGNDKDGD